MIELKSKQTRGKVTWQWSDETSEVGIGVCKGDEADGVEECDDARVKLWRQRDE